MVAGNILRDQQAIEHAAAAEKTETRKSVAGGGGKGDASHATPQAMAVELASQRRNGVSVTRMRKLGEDSAGRDKRERSREKLMA